MTLNCIWWRSSSSEDLGSVEYSFIAITPRSTLIWSGTNYKGPIDRSNRFFQTLFIFGLVQKKTLKEQLLKNVNINVQWTQIPNLLAWNTLQQVDMLLKSIHLRCIANEVKDQQWLGINANIIDKMINEPSLSYKLHISKQRIFGFMSFSKILLLCEMETTSFRIWTLVTEFIFYDNNHYIPIASLKISH